jgi:hypothetical protein
MRPGLPLSARPDVLSFRSPPLRAPVRSCVAHVLVHACCLCDPRHLTPADATQVDVTGTPTVTLYISSSRVDTDFTVKLLDIYPPSLDFPEGTHARRNYTGTCMFVILCSTCADTYTCTHTYTYTRRLRTQHHARHRAMPASQVIHHHNTKPHTHNPYFALAGSGSRQRSRSQFAHLSLPPLL